MSVRSERRFAGARLLAWLPSLLVVVALVVRRDGMLGPLPPGLDGGQWLAIGRGLLGDGGRSSPGAYAPLVPALTGTLVHVVGPIDAVRIVALGSYLLLVVTIAVVGGAMFGGVGGSAIALAIGSSSAVNEPLAFGGYPQQLALAALIVAAWGAARSCIEGQRDGGYLLLSGLAVAALAHHLYYLFALAVVGIVWGLAVVVRAPRVRRATVGVAFAVIASAALALPTLLAFRRLGYAPPLDGVALSVGGAWLYGTREAPALWLIVVLVGLGGLLPGLAGVRTGSAAVAAGLIGVGAGTFALTAEPRVLPLLLFGGLLGVGTGAAAVFAPPTRPRCPSGLHAAGVPDDSSDRRGPDGECGLAVERKTTAADRAHGPRALLRPAGVQAALVIIALVVVLPGDRTTREFIDFYRVLDPSLIAAAERIDAIGRPVAAMADRRGWPVGWWIEGLTDVPTAVGSDQRWLGFPMERQRAEDVARLFDGRRTPAEVRDLAARLGVETLLVKKWEWIGWERWLQHPQPAVEPVFDDGATLLLRVLPNETAENAGV